MFAASFCPLGAALDLPVPVVVQEGARRPRLVRVDRPHSDALLPLEAGLVLAERRRGPRGSARAEGEKVMFIIRGQKTEEVSELTVPPPRRTCAARVASLRSAPLLAPMRSRSQNLNVGREEGRGPVSENVKLFLKLQGDTVGLRIGCLDFALVVPACRPDAAWADGSQAE